LWSAGKDQSKQELFRPASPRFAKRCLMIAVRVMRVSASIRDDEDRRIEGLLRAAGLRREPCLDFHPEEALPRLGSWPWQSLIGDSLAFFSTIFA
jgi:hypothetical protein